MSLRTGKVKNVPSPTARPKLNKPALFRWMQGIKLRYPHQWVWPVRVSPTIDRLFELSVKKPARFATYQKLLNSLYDLRKETRVDLKLVLHLPNMRELLTIDIERLINNGEARNEIVRRCYLPSKGVIDLRPLVHIERQFYPPLDIG